MAYNLESLVQILEQILHPDGHHPLWVLDPNKRPQIESLLEKARFLKVLSEESSSAVTVHGRQSLESRIRDAAHDAEDILESHLVEQILSCSEGESFIFSPPDLGKVIGELDSAKEEMMTIMDNSSQIANSSSPAVSSRQDPNPKNIIVGVAEDLIHLKGQLIGQPPKALQVIPIVGMGGIGKTTLARNLYDDPSVTSHFDTRAWATISQDCNKRKLQDVLLSLLGCVIGKPNIDERLSKTDDELSLCLHQALKGRRYLIVLDDMWDVNTWDNIRRFFPDENKGSRIIVTTRESSVADYTGSGRSHHQVNLLKDDESWSLLHQKVFAPDETCSPELEKVGKKIAKDCRGIPLSILVVGGILSQAKASQDFWEQVLNNISSTVADKVAHFSNMLSLSYNHLPNHLKPCFLYIGAFPEDYEIRSSKLIKLLVAEGLVQPISDKSLEGAADMHLKALVDRNLIFVRQQGINGNAKSYGIHDLLRDLCVKKAHEEKFLFVHKWAPDNLTRSTSCLRRVSRQGPISIEDAYTSTEQMRLARSLLLFDHMTLSVPSPMISELRLLRVLDTLQKRFKEFPEEILQLVNLRYLALNMDQAFLPSSITRLCNLQVLIARHVGLGPAIVMRGISDMTTLRHIKVTGQRACVWYHGEDTNCFVVLDKLQTLSPLAISEITDMLLGTFPNVEKLGIFRDEEVDHVRDLTRLHKLHTLKCISSRYDRGNLLSNLIFPPSIKKLTVRGCQILDHHMHEIGKLSNLKVLKLQGCDFRSSKWEPENGEFCQLQFLLMEGLGLVKWAADDTHFPRLEHLVVRRCYFLEEIPLAIGEIPTLKVIEVHEYSSSAAASAREIQEAQLDIGNDDLQVRILGY